MSSSMLQLVPDFLAGVVRLHDLLAGVCFVLCFAGLTILAVQALREHSIGRTWPGIVQLILGSVLLGNLPTWCDTIMDGVQDLVHQCGWSDFPGSVYQAYDQAIATKFGTASLGNVSEILHGIGGGQKGQTAHGIHLTHYGYEQPGQQNYDSNSAAGIGAFPFDSTPGSLGNIGALRAAALSQDVANAYGLQPGQNFNIQTTGGQVLSLVYADKTDPAMSAVIDLYDPTGTAAGALDGAAVTNIAGSPVTASQGFNLLDPIGSTWALLQRFAVWLLSVLALCMMAVMVFVQQFFYQIEVALSPIFIGFFMIPALRGVATRFFTNLASILLWPLGWIVAALGTQALLDLATAAASGQDSMATGIWYPTGGVIAWIAAAVWTIGASIAAPFFISALVTASASGMIPLVAAVWARSAGAAATPVTAGVSSAVSSSVRNTVVRS